MRSVLELAEQVGEQPQRARALLEEFVGTRQFPVLDDDTATFFFWDDTHPADQVYLRHWVFGLESRQPFARLTGTNAFYLPLNLPHAARVEYKLEVVRGDRSSWLRDPLNPRQAFDPFGSNSVCPMPGYHDPPWARKDPTARKGTMRRIKIRSAAWGDERVVQVYLPAEYKSFKRYPLVICHDGADYLRFAGAKVVLDNLIHRHEVCPLIVAFTSGSRARNKEYGANDRQVSFLVDEVLPALRREFAVREDAAGVGLMGASFGGVSTLYTAWSRPGVFSKVLLQSGSFVFTDIGVHDRGPLFDPVVRFVNAFRKDPARLDAKVFLSCGMFESLIYYNRSLVPLMRRSGLSVRFVESLDGHNWIGWRDRLRDGLSWLFPGHLWMVYE